MSKTCVCCDEIQDLEDLILLDCGVYKCTVCIKNEKIVKRQDWQSFKETKLNIITSLISDLDAIDILDTIAMNQKIREISDSVLELKYFVTA